MAKESNERRFVWSWYKAIKLLDRLRGIKRSKSYDTFTLTETEARRHAKAHPNHTMFELKEVKL